MAQVQMMGRNPEESIDNLLNLRVIDNLKMFLLVSEISKFEMMNLMGRGMETGGTLLPSSAESSALPQMDFYATLARCLVVGSFEMAHKPH